MERYIFKSERLGFRKWHKADQAPFALLNKDPKVMEFFPEKLTDEASVAFLQRIDDHFKKHGFGLFAVETLINHEFIGYIGFSIPRFKAHFTPCVEIGWRLRKESWGKGLATEGALACLSYSKSQLEFRDVYSFTPLQNKRSERVMIKIGMKKVDEFDHPALSASSPLQRHHLYHISLR